MSTLIQPETATIVRPARPFMEANTSEIFLDQLNSECIIPVFAKDNERTIAHQEFIGATQQALVTMFPNFEEPEIRVSHQVKGRIPEAIHKKAADLLDHEKTVYYDRMAFVIRIPEITDTINGNKLQLTVGGVRAYDKENLYTRKGLEKFKFFIGFQNMVCCNLCVWSDGFVRELKVNTLDELRDNVLKVISNYEAEKHLSVMKEFTNYSLTEHEFAQLIGKSKLYNHLPKNLRKDIPQLEFTDTHFNMIASDYYEDPAFARDGSGEINLWNVYNLFTQANRSSYIDTIFDRGLNAFEFTQGIQRTLDGSEEYKWFLQ